MGINTFFLFIVILSVLFWNNIFKEYSKIDKLCRRIHTVAIGKWSLFGIWYFPPKWDESCSAEGILGWAFGSPLAWVKLHMWRVPSLVQIFSQSLDKWRARVKHAGFALFTWPWRAYWGVGGWMHIPQIKWIKKRNQSGLPKQASLWTGFWSVTFTFSL